MQIKQPEKFKKLLWTDEQKRYVLKNAGKISVKEIADFLGKTTSSVITQIHKMGLTTGVKV